MPFKIEKTTYFYHGGEDNTDVTLQLAKERAESLDIRTVVVASTRGLTGVKATTLFKKQNVIVVPHHTGYIEADNQEITPENRKKIRQNKGQILIATHAFGGVGRAVRRKFATYQVAEIIAATLKVFGQGMKVCAEIVLMAADAGLISIQKDVIAIAGSHRGADTAVIIQPTNARDFFNLRVKEIICKPL
jgi:hypothetical protein